MVIINNKVYFHSSRNLKMDPGTMLVTATATATGTSITIPIILGIGILSVIYGVIARRHPELPDPADIVPLITWITLEEQLLKFILERIRELLDDDPDNFNAQLAFELLNLLKQHIVCQELVFGRMTHLVNLLEFHNHPYLNGVELLHERVRETFNDGIDIFRELEEALGIPEANSTLEAQWVE